MLQLAAVRNPITTIPLVSHATRASPRLRSDQIANGRSTPSGTNRKRLLLGSVKRPQAPVQTSARKP